MASRLTTNQEIAGSTPAVVITLTALAQPVRPGYPPVTLGQACLGGQCIAFCRAYVVLLSGVNPVLAIHSVVYIVIRRLHDLLSLHLLSTLRWDSTSPRSKSFCTGVMASWRGGLWIAPAREAALQMHLTCRITDTHFLSKMRNELY